MAKTKTKINATLSDFLFNQIENDPAYQLWEREFILPEYISDNLSKTLRDYQVKALKHFIWLFENDRTKAKHLMFNMATGTGKTLVMAAVVLYLFAQGYRNFIFLVHQIQIKDQALKNFTDYKFEKYLFNPKGVRINGRNIPIKEVSNFSDADNSAINFFFFSTSLLYNRIIEEKENELTAEDFVENNVVIIADEAHRLNVDTRSKKKKDVEEVKNWETAVMSAINANDDNILLEYTATVDLANQDIHKKYTDKIISRYDFLEFNRDGYSKDVKFLYNKEIHTEDQKRLLIINAVALSEYRRLLAEREMGIDLKPIVLIKSVKISQSEEDREFFDSVISSLRPDDLKRLLELGKEHANREHEILKDMFAWLSEPKNGMVTTGDWDGLHKFVNEIRASFAHDNTLIYNSQKKEKADLLPLLDSPRNTIRAIFSVNALNEGWDVLSLYDIIHFDISESKKVSLQDIQLIGRGARYFPYELPKEYIPDDKSNLALEFNLRNLEIDKYKRKFDNAPFERGRVLETFVYHFVKTGMFLENLQRDLLGEGIISEGVEKKTINLKQHFLKSDTYTKGFVLINQKQKRTKTTDEEIDTTFNRTIKAGLYNLRSRALSDYEQNQQIASQKTKKIKVTEEYFAEPIIRKALVSAEANFFRFNNLILHLPDLKSVDELIDKYLPKYEITYTYEDGKDINLLSAQEKLQLLVGAILPEVRRRIDIYMPRESGSNVFRPVSLSQVFGQEKNIYLMSFPIIDPVTGKKVFISTDERAKAQSDHDNPELQFNVKDADWYAYSENYGTSEEKKFVRYLASQIEDLQNTYTGAEIYLIRNELDYWLYSINDGRRFSPDYILIINDVVNKRLYYQVIIEPKGGHLLEQDAWKEEALIALNDDSEVVFDSKENDKKAYAEYLKEMEKNGYKEVKPIGIKFYNSDTRGESDFALDFEGKLLTEDGKK